MKEKSGALPIPETEVYNAETRAQASFPATIIIPSCDEVG